MFNENRSCIEILNHPMNFQFLKSLMKTEVVLKYVNEMMEDDNIVFNENRSCIEICAPFDPDNGMHQSLMKTEVVLKLK